MASAPAQRRLVCFRLHGRVLCTCSLNTRYVTLGVPSLLICGLAAFLFMGNEKVATPARGSLQMINASWNMTRGIWSVRSRWE
jgi:hypothetical protein